MNNTGLRSYIRRSLICVDLKSKYAVYVAFTKKGLNAWKEAAMPTAYILSIHPVATMDDVFITFE